MIWNEKMETMPRDELEALQLSRLQRVIERAYEGHPFYRTRLDESGVKPAHIKSLEDVRLLPFTVKTDLGDRYPFGFFAVPLKEVTRIHASSGTKGKPTVVGYTRNDVGIWAELCARCLASAGAQPGDLLHNAYGYGLFTGGLGFHYGGELMGLTVVPVSSGNTLRQIMLIQDFKPQGLGCTPSFALYIAETMLEKGIDTSSLSLKYGILGAEPWTDEMRKQIEEKLNIDAVDIYGLSEAIGPGVACECAQAKNGLHVYEDHFFAEVIDPATAEPVPYGQPGELVITTLTKEAFPVIRYRTGDICSLLPEKCLCGRTQLRMSRVKGRSDDMLIIRGVNVYPSEIESVLLTIKELAPYYQLVVDKTSSLSQLEVQVEISESAQNQLGLISPGDLQIKELRQRVREALRATLTLSTGVTILPAKALPRTEGKAVRVVEKKIEPGS